MIWIKHLPLSLFPSIIPLNSKILRYVPRNAAIFWLLNFTFSICISISPASPISIIVINVCRKRQVFQRKPSLLQTSQSCAFLFYLNIYLSSLILSRSWISLLPLRLFPLNHICNCIPISTQQFSQPFF